MMQVRGLVVDTQQLSQYQEAIPVRRTYQMSIITVLLGFTWEYKDVPDLVTGAVNIELSGAAADLWEVGDIEDDSNPGNQVGEHHPPEHLTLIIKSWKIIIIKSSNRVSNVCIGLQVTEGHPVSEGRHRVERHEEEQGEAHPRRGGGLGLKIENWAKQSRHRDQVDRLVVGETVKVVDDDPDIGPVQGDQDGGVVNPLPLGPGVMTWHRVKHRAG